MMDGVGAPGEDRSEVSPAAGEEPAGPGDDGTRPPPTAGPAGDVDGPPPPPPGDGTRADGAAAGSPPRPAPRPVEGSEGSSPSRADDAGLKTPSWRAGEEEGCETVIEIEELPPAEKKPVAGRIWRQRTRDGPAPTPPAPPAGPGAGRDAGTRPRVSSNAAMERCLLGWADGDEGRPPPRGIAGEEGSEAPPPCGSECRPGHVIDLLDLRRLSSRGVPDRPPGSWTPVSGGGRKSLDGGAPSGGNRSGGGGGGGGGGRSYRPLVWRVLLGYLPPQTEIWDEVLGRDRGLYANLVAEFFSSTCPDPHDDGPAEATAGGEGEGDDVPPGPPPTTPTPTTPGLLSARMQQEWIRGDLDGDGGVFGTPKGAGGANKGGAMSPMCAMNTPRTRARRQAVPRADSASGDGGNSPGEARVREAMDELDRRLSIGSPGAVDVVEDHDDEEEMIDVSITNDREGDDANFRIDDDDDGGGGEGGGGPPSGAVGGIPPPPLCKPDGNRVRNDRPPSCPDTDEEENLLLLDEVRKDVIRTHPDLRFFLEPADNLGQKRYAALERILFVWAKLNKGVRYVQGMNEIVGTLYFVLAQDSDESWSRHAEADTYFLFNALMVEIRDVFMAELDEADTGIHGRISNMITLLSLHDPEVRCHLDEVGIDPSFYSVRWLTTLLSREFLLPDTVRLWDSMFASTHKDNFLRYVSVTMVMVIRDRLLAGDFSACLRLLQAYPPPDLDMLLESSRALWIYESQVTLACHKGGISLGHALRSIPPPPSIVMAYGLHAGRAPPVSRQVREAGERLGRSSAAGASSVASAGRSMLGSAMSFLRGNSRE